MEKELSGDLAGGEELHAERIRDSETFELIENVVNKYKKLSRVAPKQNHRNFRTL